MKPRLLPAITFVALSSAAIAAQDQLPQELYSPNHGYSVRILSSALPGADPYDGFFTIAVCRDEQYMAKYPTVGFLLDAFWSPTKSMSPSIIAAQTAAIIFGCFGWGDGRAIRMPVDAGPGHPEDAYEKYVENLTRRIGRKFPELTSGEFRKLFTFAKGWTNAGDLVVKTNFAFRNLPDDQIAILLQTFRVADDKLVLIDEKADKAPWPPKT